MGGLFYQSVWGEGGITNPCMCEEHACVQSAGRQGGREGGREGGVYTYIPTSQARAMLRISTVTVCVCVCVCVRMCVRMRQSLVSFLPPQATDLPKTTSISNRLDQGTAPAS
jgi:hypothetical protein